MAKYVYPAVFTPEEGGLYSVYFPDIEGCYTCGDDLENAMEMAEDVLSFALWGYEREEKDVPSASSLDNIKLEEGEFVSYVKSNTLYYRKLHDKKSVKKTLSIPSWLNEEAEKAGVNYSQVLQEALKNKLGVF